jgi:hypothetical protein
MYFDKNIKGIGNIIYAPNQLTDAAKATLPLLESGYTKIYLENVINPSAALQGTGSFYIETRSKGGVLIDSN